MRRMDEGVQSNRRRSCRFPDKRKAPANKPSLNERRSSRRELKKMLEMAGVLLKEGDSVESSDEGCRR